MRVLGGVSAILFLFACKPGLSNEETGNLQESDTDTDTDTDSDTDTDTDTDTDADTDTDTDTDTVPERECPDSLEIGDTGSFKGTPPNPGFVMLADPLDSPSGAHYCADVPGAGVDVDDILQAHTCKPPIDNEVFATDAPEFGQIAATNYSDFCIEAKSVDEGGLLRMEKCSTSTTQNWVSGADGEIHPADNLDLCWVVSTGAGGSAGGGGGSDELRRPMSIERCDSVADAYKLWVVPCGNVGTWGTDTGK